MIGNGNQVITRMRIKCCPAHCARCHATVWPYLLLGSLWFGNLPIVALYDATPVPYAGMLLRRRAAVRTY